MKKLKVIFCLIILSVLLSLNIQVRATEVVPDDGAKITSAQIIQNKTGTGPWDENDEPGNDSSDENDIVRSFDRVTWTIENTMGLNNTDAEGYNGGKIYFEAKLPNTLNSATAAWNLDAMGWIEQPTLSADKMTLSGYYQLGTDTITIPGKQTLLFEANVYGAKNGTQFTPEFKLWMNGNGEENVKTVSSKTITISSKPRYNLKLARGDINTNVEIDIDGTGELKDGKVYNYNMLFQLIGDNSAKGLKGMDYPEGDLTFDINLQLDRTTAGTTEDITNLTSILIYNYSKNGDDGSRAISGRPNLGFYSGVYTFPYPNRYNVQNPTQNVLDRYIYNSGKISMEQEGNVIHVTIKDYDFDGIFPTKSYDGSNNNVIFADNIGNVSKICFQIYVLNNDETQVSGSNYYLKVSNSNMKVNSISGTEVIEQALTNDDATSVQYVAYSPGTYHTDYYFHNTSGNNIHSAWNRADGVVYNGQKVYGTIANFSSSNNRARRLTVKSLNILYKFDNNAFHPTVINGRQYWISGISADKLSGKFYYAAKPDGTGWASITEMNSAKFEDLEYYSSLEELEADGKICVGSLFESDYCEWYVPESTTCIYFRTALEVTDDAEMAKTYQECGQVRYYNYELDRTTQSMAVEGGTYPTDYVYQNYATNYKKTEYDENGVQISGTHVDVHRGNSLLIVGAKTVVKNEIMNLSFDGTTKTSYDMGRSEYEVTYRISPAVNKAVNTQSSVTTTLRITDELPNGLTYVPNSCTYGEPDITINADGSSTLVWYMYDIEVGEAIQPFTLDVHINEESMNGVQYTTTVTAFAGDIDKSNEANRQSSNTINIVNLSSHRLFKTDVTPVIEEDGTIHFVVSYKNNTDDPINNFQLLDILPYNGDGRGTLFNGTYKIEKIELSQEDVAGNPLTNDNLKIYYTNDTSARNANSKDTDLADGWNEASTTNLMVDATAVVLKGIVLGQEKVNLDIYLKTEDNKGLDKYVNNASAQVYVETEKMVTSNVTTQVVLRTIEGIAWYDLNANGLKDANETLAHNVTLTLTDENYSQVTDVNGQVVSSIQTNNEGYYKFTDLPMGNYYVRVAMPDGTYMLTEKEVGTNATINSKFNVDSATTDEITKLNSIDLPVLTQSNVNAGFVKKPTKVVVNYLEKGTTTKLLDEYTINGRIDDEYSTTNRLADVNAANANKYAYDSVDGEVSGTMVEDTIYITYYFVKKDTNVKVLHVEEGTDVTNPESVTDVLYNTETISGKVDDEYTTSNKLNEINVSHTEQYDFVRSTTNTSGTMTVDTIYVIYEYKKAPAVVKVQHLEQGTNTPLQDEETLNGVVGLDYTTTNKLSEINAENANKYELVTPEPSNKNGTYAREEQTVTYYYQKKPTKVVVLHVEEGTDVTDPASVTDVLYPTEEMTGRVDDAYNTSAKTDEINATTTAKYALVATPTNANGSMTVDTIYVIYVYRKQDTSLLVKHVDVITGELLDSKTIEGYIGDKVTTQEGTFERYKLYEKPTTEEYTLTEEPQTVTYYYIKQADVVVEYLDEITGNYVAPYDRTTYTEREEYTTAPKTVADYTLTTDSGNTAGTVYRDDIFVKYYYKKNTSLVVKYVDYYTGEIISPTITMTGVQGQEYTTEQKEIPDYVYVEVIGKPNGQMDREPQEVIYRYKKQANLITEHIDINTGEKIIPDVIKKYMEKEEYEALGQNFPGYVLVQAPEQTKGIMEREDVTKTFYYKKISGGLIVKYVDVLSGELLDQVEYTGNEGDPVTFEEKSFIYYFLHSTPEVDNATLTVEPQEYIYYYIKMGSVNVIGIDQDTREELYRYSLNGVEGEKYEAYPRTLDGYKLVVIPNNEKGTYERNTPDVIYEYKKYSGTVDVEYIDKDTGELLGTDKMSGVIGESYKTEQRTYEGYRFVNVEGETIGTYSEEEKLVKYYYERKTGRVVVKYITEDGTELAREEDSGKVGESFHFTEKEFEEYEVVSRPDSLDGTYVEGLIELVIVLKPTDVLGEESGTIIVNFKDRQGNVLKQQVVSQDLVGEEFYLEAPDIEGYTIVGDRIVKATYINGELVYDIIYEKIEEKPAEPVKETVDTGDLNVIAMLIVLAVSACGITLVKKYKKD